MLMENQLLKEGCEASTTIPVPTLIDLVSSGASLKATAGAAGPTMGQDLFAASIPCLTVTHFAVEGASADPRPHALPALSQKLPRAL